METEIKIKKTADMKKYRNEYYAKNKQRFMRFHKAPYHCDVCNRDILHGSKRNHLNSGIHKTHLKYQNIV